MSEEKKDKKTQQKLNQDLFDETVKDMASQIGDIIDPKKIDELQVMLNDLIGMAQDVKEEFEEEMSDTDINENDISSSIEEVIQVSENSPYLNEMFKGEDWKKVLTDFSNIGFKNSGSKDAD
tara:strand:+ start:329 stop:694 length:366 start_codon:yes stop_codon:yes gene_type:complete